uniref:Uncharacterized protein LOC111104406 n=1 Tax=Crassostrea virginica TaxID=6565 RepID=A0A8B8ATP1_CRAVI|nr:uncharacterized protein LOC111104406 [Crassostrea virginica]
MEREKRGGRGSFTRHDFHPLFSNTYMYLTCLPTRKMTARVYIAYTLCGILYGFYCMKENGACNEDSYVLTSCDGSIISNKIINVDFHFIKDKCSCAFESNFSVLYYLSRNPGYKDCGTGINISESDTTTHILRCATESTDTGSLGTSLATQVRLIRDNNYPLISGNEDYCLSVFSNNKSHHVRGFCGTFSTTSRTTIMNDLGGTYSATTPDISMDRGDGLVMTKDEYLIIMIAAIAGASLVIIFIIAVSLKIFRKRKNNDVIHLRDDITDDLYAQRKEIQPENTLPQSTESIKTPNPHPSSYVDNRGSGLWVVENTFYQSADNVTNDNDDDGNEMELEVDNTVYYSEIKDNENKGTTKVNVDLVYDYAHVIDKMS